VSTKSAIRAPGTDVALVAEIMREIRNRVSPIAARRESYAHQLNSIDVLVPEFRDLTNLVDGVRSAATLVGSMPPAPNTLRGRVGAMAVGLVQRALFWYTPQLHAFHLKVSAALTEQARAIDILVADLREAQKQIAELKRMNRELSGGTQTGSDAASLDAEEHACRP
jgi:hypothetical protein